MRANKRAAHFGTRRHVTRAYLSPEVEAILRRAMPAIVRAVEAWNRIPNDVQTRLTHCATGVGVEKSSPAGESLTLSSHVPPASAPGSAKGRR